MAGLGGWGEGVSIGEWIEQMWTSGSALALAATGAGVLTFIAILILARAQKRRHHRLRYSPKVVAYAAPNPRFHGFVDLVVENIGSGAAYDVKLPHGTPVMPGGSRQAWDMAEFIQEGIPSLNVGERRTYSLGHADDLLSYLEAKPGNIVVSFRPARGEPGVLSTTAHLDAQTLRALWPSQLLH